MCSPSNTCFLRPSQVHTPNGILISSVVFAQLKANDLYSSQWAASFPLRIAFRHRGIWTPVSYMLPWAHRTQIPNSTLIGSAVFAQLTAESVYTLKWAVPTPVKITLPHGGSRPLSNTWFPGPTWVHNSNGILASSVVFARLTTMTDRPCYSISNNRPHLRSTAMLRCGRIQYFCTARDITRCTSDGLTTLVVVWLRTT